MNVWPRLPLTVATSLAEEVARLPRAQLLERASDWDESVILAPVGGTSVDRMEVRRIQGLVRARMNDAADRGPTEDAARRSFDFEVSKVLLEEMAIAPHEAAQAGVWAFIACVALPDVVRWRFPGDDGTGTPVRRFTGGARGVRNAFGRLWWRAYVLRDPEAVEPWELVRIVLEDQAVGILERPMLSGFPPLAREVLRSVVASGGAQQQEVMRDVTKRLRRMAGVIPFEAVTSASLRDLVSIELQRSVTSLGGRTEARTEPTGEEPSPAPPPSPAAPPMPTEPPSAPPAPLASATGPLLTVQLVPALLDPGPRQGVVKVPDALAPMLPPLVDDFANPERNVIAVDDDGRRWLWRYVHYNRSHGGRHLEGLSGYLRQQGARPGDKMRMRVRTDGFIDVTVVRAAASSVPHK